RRTTHPNLLHARISRTPGGIGRWGMGEGAGKRRQGSPARVRLSSRPGWESTPHGRGWTLARTLSFDVAARRVGAAGLPWPVGRCPPGPAGRGLFLPGQALFDSAFDDEPESDDFDSDELESLLVSDDFESDFSELRSRDEPPFELPRLSV